MSQLNKQQLELVNQTNFPNNNTQFITPDKLREMNTDIIDSMVDEISYNIDSSSIVTHLDSLQAEVDALVLSGSGVVIQEEGVTQGTATLLNFVGGSVTASVSGGFATINVNATATDLSGLNQFSASVNQFTASIQAEVDSLQDKTGSYATTGSNTFNGNQTISGSLNGSQSISSSIQQGSVIVGGAGNRSVTV